MTVEEVKDEIDKRGGDSNVGSNQIAIFPRVLAIVPGVLRITHGYNTIFVRTVKMNREPTVCVF